MKAVTIVVIVDCDVIISCIRIRTSIGCCLTCTVEDAMGRIRPGTFFNNSGHKHWGGKFQIAEISVSLLSLVPTIHNACMTSESIYSLRDAHVHFGVRGHWGHASEEMHWVGWWARIPLTVTPRHIVL